MSSSEVLQLLPPGLPLWQFEAFNTLYILGFVLLAIVVLPPLFARNVRRSGLWFAFLGSWMVYCFSFMLLIGHQLGPDPPFSLCIFQAAMIHAAPALSTLAGVCFIVDIYFSLHTTICGQSGWIPQRRAHILLALPILVFFGVFSLSLAIGAQDHTTISREQNQLFCHVNTGLPTLVSAIISGWSIAVALGFDIAGAILVGRNWHRTPFSQAANASASKSDPNLTQGMLVRILLFSLLTILGLGLSALSLFGVAQQNVKWNILLPILPILAALLFGSQKDILMGWVFWRRPKGPQVGAA